MDKAKAAGAPKLALAASIGLFTLGNALDAWLGGVVIAQGFGFTPPNWAGGMLSIGALASNYCVRPAERFRRGCSRDGGSLTGGVAAIQGVYLWPQRSRRGFICDRQQPIKADS